MPFRVTWCTRVGLILWLVGVAGAFGCVVDRWRPIGPACTAGRPLIEKYGRYVLISRHDLDLPIGGCDRFGEIIVRQRLLPVIGPS